MLDTGACTSLIEKGYLEEREIENSYTNLETVPIFTANQELMTNSGRVEITLQAGTSSSCLEVVVVDTKLPTPILLGRDYLSQNNISIETNPTQVRINGESITVNPKADHQVYIIKVDNYTSVKGKQNLEVEDDELLVDDSYVKASAVESVQVTPSSMGYVNLITPLIDSEEARFEPNQGNSQARVLCPGIVKLHRHPEGDKTIFTVQYLNTETHSIDIEEGSTLGEVYPCTSHPFINEKAIVASVVEGRTESRQEKLYELADKKFPNSPRENSILKSLISKYPGVFSTQNDPLSVTPYYMCSLKQIGDEAVWRKPYPIPVSYHIRIQEQLRQLHSQGTIRPSKSPYNAPLIPVPKKDGGLRLCLDFRALNTKLKDDKYPLPNIKAILQQLGQSSIFSCLDMYQGYHQIPLDEESIEKTAFTSPEGHWEFTALPFGIKTAPACFQRIVNSILIGLIGNSAFVYLDDVIIHGRSFEEHVQNLEKVLDRLQDAKLTLKFEKCEFFTSQVNYLGHVVSSEGLKPQASKVEVIKNMEAPKTIKELQSFLGMINYYRKFIKDFSKVASPLNGLMKGAVNKKNNKTPLNWTEEAQTAFAELKSKLAEEVTLSFPDFSKNFILTTDASDKCIGGVLQQRDDEGRIRPISFFSRTLNPAETRYSTIEKEALATVTDEYEDGECPLPLYGDDDSETDVAEGIQQMDLGDMPSPGASASVETPHRITTNTMQGLLIVSKTV
ncbi:hypothetical protein Pmani_010278 [Petrolisthes manimaculis]|uniref:Reverse transcriptase domain-containing protein n=1 Tax=Petrolisthes manimaculis TaxID=1843537 RepID=A0AAE1UCU9_9EUCA|nr:hypothetical protein Pmani_010278 [Petrolisthes manimaculis]